MFRTELNIAPAENKINLKDKIFSTGSCFAVNTGRILKDFKFDVLINPFGTLFNPVSVFRTIGMGLHVESLDEASYVRSKGICMHFDLHSHISAPTKEDLRGKFETKRKLAKKYLQDARLLMVTLGTAVVYEWEKTGRVVANCHKIPAGEFHKRMLTTEEIVEGFSTAYQLLSKHNPDVRFILSVSPVRHIRDGFINNSLSKSILRVAASRIVSRFERADYFPSFEIMMDDLRDYRFYDRDMLHPSVEAIDYIWEKFRITYFDEETLRFCKGWEQVRKDLAHRPFHARSENHQKFLRAALKRLEKFEVLVDVAPERRMFQEQMV